MNRLTVDRLTYHYPGTEAPAVRDVTTTVEPGVPLLVAGANGAGKSTLLAAMAGFAPHFFHGTITGDVMLDDRSMQNTPLAEWVMQVGLVFSDPFNQISGARLTVFEEVAFGLENLGVPPAEIRARVGQILNAFGLAGLAERSPYALSGGQQQRVAIASILVLEPAVLALDEPTSQLDPVGTREVMTVLHDLASAGHAIALATHKIERARDIVGQALILSDGSAARQGPAGAVLDAPDLVSLGVVPPLSTRLHREGGRQLSPRPDVPVEALQLSESVPVVVENVAFRYPSGVVALRDVSLRLEPGEIIALVGANGAGKTTLSKMLNGLLRPEQGRIHLGDRDTAGRTVAHLARHVGYVFQNPADQLFKRTVREEVAFGPENLGFSPARRDRAIEEALTLCGLDDLADAHPYDLLPSQRRWVAIAGVLAMQTPIMILDEPTGGFDYFEVQRLHRLLQALRVAGRTILLISHDMAFVSELADRVVVMADGRILAAGTPAEILADDTLLAQADLEPPPVVQLARRLGVPTTITREAELFAALGDAGSP